MHETSMLSDPEGEGTEAHPSLAKEYNKIRTLQDVSETHSNIH